MELQCHAAAVNESIYMSAAPLVGKARTAHLEAMRAKYLSLCPTPISTAVAIVNNKLVIPTRLPHAAMPARFKGDAGSEWRYAPAALEASRALRGGCLVYAFGTQHADEFTDFWAAQTGCQVFAFDPTVTYYKALPHPAITFHPWGLTSVDSANDARSELASIGHYGKVSGTLLTLREIVARLGHQGRTLTALKLDCEGCEWTTIRDMYCQADAASDGGAIPRVLSLNIEFHLSLTFRMTTAADVERIRYVGLYLRGWRSFQFKGHMPFRGMVKGYRGGAHFMHPDLNAAGVPWDVCCYVAGYVNERLIRELNTSAGTDAPMHRHKHTEEGRHGHNTTSRRQA